MAGVEELPWPLVETLPMRKLILKCGLAPGDIVLLTAAVRDLHKSYPGRFLTDVRAVCPDLWEHNIHITPLEDKDPEAESIECSYPLIDRSNETPYHCLHGFIEFLNDRLGLSIKPTAFKGDIHLSAQEKAWYSQVHEVTGEDTPFWIVAAGGKYDVTIKWWETKRYQQVIDHFRGRIQFVQVGARGHHHPKLEGVIDLRGRTSLRELIRLVYHSQGVLCSVTALMHLAAAVETRPGRPVNRPCVVVAGGREPAHWEAYPDHQFIHTNGALPCCANGGCWKDRTFRLRDGDSRDKNDHLCVDVVNGLPHCLHLITADEVIRRIELYFSGNMVASLSASQRIAAQGGVAAAAKNDFDQEPLNWHNAGMACDRFIHNIPPFPQRCQGRGIVICGGGVRYFTNAWVCINMLRRLGCRLPIECWHLGEQEMDSTMETLLEPLRVQCVDACKIRKKSPARRLHGWELKPYAILHSSFREVLLLDADNVPVVNPEFLFDTPQFRTIGAIFWPDYASARNKKTKAIWRSCGLRQPDEREFETGQVVLDKQRCWAALSLTMWFNENSDFYYQHLHGDKETFHLAFRKLKSPYSLVPKPIHSLHGTMCQHDFQGRRILQHRNTDKWDLLLHNRRVKGFWFEKECSEYVVNLRRLWDGRAGYYLNGCLRPKKRSAGVLEGRSVVLQHSNFPARRRSIARPLRICAVMISCPERDKLRKLTLRNLNRTDWDGEPLHVQIDEGKGPNREKRQTRCAHIALQKASEMKTDYVLFLEDDLDFNRHLCHNLYNWPVLKTKALTLGSLYYPQLRELACDLKSNARIVAPTSVFGSQALLISKAALRHILRHWHRVQGMQDIKISRLAGSLGDVIFYHAPSLVQHIGKESTFGAPFHQASDFHQDWKAQPVLLRPSPA